MTDEQLQQILTELRNINSSVQAVVSNTEQIATNTAQAVQKLDHLLLKFAL